MASKIREAHEVAEATTNELYREHEAIMQQALSKIKTLEGSIEQLEADKAALRDNVQALERKVVEQNN